MRRLNAMRTKYEAVEKFNFMKKVYSKIPGSGFVKGIEGMDSPEIDVCGVFFFKEYAYTTNNHIIGRIRVDDNMPLDEPIFWSYNKSSENVVKAIADKFLLNVRGYCSPSPIIYNIFNNFFIDNLDVFFNRFSSNVAYIRKNDLLSLIDTHYAERDTKKMKVLVSMNIGPEKLNLQFNPLRPSVRNVSFEDSINLFTMPSRAGNVKTDGGTCTMNLFYLYELLSNSFDEYEVVGIKYKADDKVPIVIFGKNRHSEKPNIYWAVAQSTV
jgi:hypothetical protein